MSISENYEGEITPIRSNISRFRDAQLLIVTLYLLCFILDGKNQFFGCPKIRIKIDCNAIRS